MDDKSQFNNGFRVTDTRPTSPDIADVSHLSVTRRSSGVVGYKSSSITNICQQLTSRQIKGNVFPPVSQVGKCLLYIFIAVNKLLLY